MTPRGNQHQIGIDVDLGQGGDATPLEDTPFRLAVLGDFSGRASRGLLGTGDEIAKRLPVRVDRDDLDAAISALSVELHLSLAGADSPRISVRLSSLDDFHPDQLLDRVPLLKAMASVRKRLADPKTFAAAASELSRNPGQLPPRPPAAPSSAEGEEFKVHHPTDGAGLLDAILGEGPAAAEPGHAESPADLHAFIQKVIRSHVVPRPDPRQADLLAEVDAALGEMMRALLHHPDFLALEAAWRGIDRLVRRVPTSSELQIHLLDLSAAELRLDLGIASPSVPSGTSRLLKEASADQPWALIAGLYTFGPDDEDLQQLGKLAALGRALGAPWISAATPSLVGAPSLLDSTDPRDWKAEPARFWNPLRQSAEARWLGLALPRYLVRLPYGKKTEACERFPFEEWDAKAGHDDYCWGNPALLVAELHAVAFAEHRWRMKGQIEVEIGSLPLHVTARDDAMPVAEVLLPVKAAERIQEWGVMALATLKGADAARFGRLQSVAEPLAALAGRWSAPA